MFRHGFRLPAAALLIALMAWSCTKDSLPTTPDPPFLFTKLRISKNITPLPSTKLTVGQNVTVRFEVNYTLSQADDQGRSKLGLFADVYSEDAASAVTILSTSPASPPPLSSSAATVVQSLTFTVPAGARFVTVEAYMDTIPFKNPVVRLDSETWTVQ